MAVNLSFIGGAGWQFFDDNGVPLSGGKIFTYAAGTTTPLATYTSRDGLTPNTNPIILDAAGRTPSQIWSTEGLLYKYVVKNANDTLIRTWDNIGGSEVASDLAQDLANTTDDAKGDALIGFRQSNTAGFLAGATARTVNEKLQETVSVKDFGAVGDGVTDDTTAIQTAIDAAQNRILFFPAGTYRVSSTIYLGSRGSIAGEGPKASKFLLTHAGVGFYTRDVSGQTDYTRNQSYSNFGVVCNTSTTVGLWAIRTLYCTFTNIEITVPQSAGTSFAGWRVAGSVYFTTFINCLCDTIEENAAIKQGGRAWWIGAGENAEGNIFAATNANTWINCRGVRANVCFDIDSANGCTIIGGGVEHSVTAGYHIRGDYTVIIGAWVEDADIVFDQSIPQDGSGGFLPARSPSLTTLSVARPIDNITINYAAGVTISNSRISNLTIGANASNVSVNDVIIVGTLTDNGVNSSLEYFKGGDNYLTVKNGSTSVYSAQYGNGDTKIDLNGSQFIRSQRFGPLSFSSNAKFKFTGSDTVFEIGKTSAPSVSPADTAYLFVRDNGAGKMQLAARFPSGAIQVIATEP